MVLELASLEKKKKKKERKKENDDFRNSFSRLVWKSEDIFVLRRVRAFHFVDIELSYDILSPLPIVLSKHFNHPHPYIEITTVISDNTPEFLLATNAIVSRITPCPNLPCLTLPSGDLHAEHTCSHLL